MKKLGEGATPGPWHTETGLYGNEGEITIWGVKNDDGCSEFVATLGNMQNHDKGNARLLAKAPLLVEARDVLTQLMIKLDEYGWSPEETDDAIYFRDAMNQARALLIKLEAE